MKLYLLGQTMRYEAGNLCFLFFPGEKIEEETDLAAHGDFYAIMRFKRGKTQTHVLVLLGRAGKKSRAHATFSAEAKNPVKAGEHALGRAFLTAGEALCGFRPPWGILTGIRPVKLARELLASGLDERQAALHFTKDLWVSPQKATLCLHTAREETRITALSTPQSASLYISIPFCPTRCLYCSFISQDVEKSKKLLPAYVEKLCSELAAVGALAKKLHLRLETIYMGGGTPTSLSAPMLTQIFDTVRAAFFLDYLREYTVEAGRPDTITPEKLAAIKAGGCTRLCINPQTLDAAVLQCIGRAHTPEQFFTAFAAARAAGFTSINTDLIAGLPGDTPEGFARTLDLLLPLAPEGVTVHTLAMKRSSRLVSSGGARYDACGQNVERMLSDAYGRLDDAGLAPYYLYRQRNTVGNLENTGFARPGHEGLYNVFIMDETHTILAAGAGGVTKMKQPAGVRIKRVFNFKYPYEYLARFDEVLARKQQVEAFYDGSAAQNPRG
ncbi:coproporphyrinogen dehydrogenase HemZ [Ethanoligenens sp.]|uniref:coproporphyrinogen dehydrogenase HemZ n=1 Tax=Ethanoligenens sp. TaxID=2099655 RepID=UPI0039EADEEB